MKVVIMGCGRVGAALGVMLADEGHDVTMLDVNAESFRRLPAGFKGKRHIGSDAFSPHKRIKWAQQIFAACYSFFGQASTSTSASTRS